MVGWQADFHFPASLRLPYFLGAAFTGRRGYGIIRLINRDLGAGMEFTKDDLKEAKRQIDSTLHKLREVVKTFEAKESSERYKSQITLAKRRITAFEIANWLIEEELKK